MKIVDYKSLTNNIRYKENCIINILLKNIKHKILNKSIYSYYQMYFLILYIKIEY